VRTSRPHARNGVDLRRTSVLLLDRSEQKKTLSIGRRNESASAESRLINFQGFPERLLLDHAAETLVTDYHNCGGEHAQWACLNRQVSLRDNVSVRRESMQEERQISIESHLSSVTDGCLAGGGVMGGVMRANNWHGTQLGPTSMWPQSLRTSLSICLASRFPIVLYWGPDFITLYNDAYSQILAEKHPWALGRPCAEVWSEIWDVIGPMLRGVVDSAQATWSDDQLLILNRHGYSEECYFSFSFSPVRDETGAIGGIFTAVTENTQRVIGERRLRTLRELGARAVEARTPDHACQLAVETISNNCADLPFALLYLIDMDSAHLAGAAGFSGARPAPAAVVDLRSVNCGPVARVARTGKGELVSDGGTPSGVWKSAFVAPIAGGSGQPAGVLVVGISSQQAFDDSYRGFIDLVASHVASSIANAKAYIEEKKRAEALAQLDRAKTAFFSNVSHEFRTPLTLMLGPLEDAMAESLPAPTLAALEVAHRNSLRLLKLVNTLLDFSRIEADRIQAAYEPTNLGLFTAELASGFRSTIERAGMRFTVDCPEIEEPIYVDRDMWEKIVLNLLSNAFKFTFEGAITLSLRSVGDTVQMMVQDTGVGIPPVELPNLFKRFHRVKGTQGRSYEGSGIGLALVHDLVKLHRGTVQVESALAQGSTFIVSIPKGSRHLPVERIGPRTETSIASYREAYIDEVNRWLPVLHESGGQESDRRPAADGASPALVLLADDNADMREYLQTLLAEQYEVVAVGDGHSALQAARSRAPDLILTDIMMPRMDGFTLLRKLRCDETLKTIPVIMLSARAGEEARIDGVSAGADDYLVKPFSGREVLARVATHLRLRRMREEARKETEQALRERSHSLEIINRIGSALAAELDLEKLVQAITDAGREATGAAFGAFFYNIKNEAGESHLLHTLSGVPKERFAAFPMPTDRAVFEPTFRGEGVVRLADVRQYPRYGQNSPYPGMRNKHLPVRSYLAVPVVSRSGEVLGGLFYGHEEVNVFTEEAEQIISAIASQAAIAIDNAQLYREAQKEIAERRQMEKALKDADRRKDEFLAMLAHELRNPLAPIRNASEVLKLIGSPDTNHERACVVIERQTQHLTRLVEDLLDVSRITQGKVTLHHATLDLSAVMKRAVEVSRAQIDARKHQFSVVFPSESVQIIGDLTRLVQVIGNLLDNAAKYTNEGGDIRLEAERDGDDAVIRVCDNGIGIPADLLPRVFDLFTQADRSLDRSQGGLGIGLTLVHKLVELHGGKVEAKSEGVDHGSEFTIRIPVLKPESMSEPAKTSDVLKPQTSSCLRIMVIEDNRDSVEMLEVMLKLRGHEVHTLCDGRLASAEALSFRPQVVLCDIGLPIMNGYDVAKCLRALPDLNQTVLVALTGYGNEEDRRRAKEAGFNYHLTKPVELEALQAVLNSLL
jgi:signal transduction histidine kinase